MCGIVGMSGGCLEGLAVANDLLAHRGPDDSGVFVDQNAGAVALVSTAKSTIFVSYGLIWKRRG